jgi:predicted metal-dependent hydrolase
LTTATATRRNETQRPAQIKARRTRFDLSGTPLHWVPGDPQSSQMINVLHVVLPPGERWFCDVYRDALPLITDERLRDEVRGFIGQEATHAKAHDLGLDYLASHGIDLRAEVAWADRTRARARRGLRKLPAPVFRRVLNAELAAIAAIEHFTAVLGGWILESTPLDEAAADPQMLDLLRWHGAEEVEHRSVAFDLYEHLDGSYVRRVAHGLVVSVGLTAGMVAVGSRLMALDPTVDRNLSWRAYRSATTAGRIPRLGEVMRSVRGYLQRDHHPSQLGSLTQALAYLAASPGVTPRSPRSPPGP